jgi:hypothetical protein
LFGDFGLESFVVNPNQELADIGGDRTFKLSSGITSGYGRYVKPLWGAPWRAPCYLRNGGSLQCQSRSGWVSMSWGYPFHR